MPHEGENPAAVEAMRTACKAGTDLSFADRRLVRPRHGGQRGVLMEVGKLPPPVPASSKERLPSRSGPPLSDEHQITNIYEPGQGENLAVEVMRAAREAGTDPEFVDRHAAPRLGGQRGTLMEVGKLPPPVPPWSRERPPSRSGRPLRDEIQTTHVYQTGHLRSFWEDNQTTRVYGPEATETIRQEAFRATQGSATELNAPVGAALAGPASARSRTPSLALPLTSHAAPPRAKPFGSDTDRCLTPNPPSDEKVGGLILDGAEREALTRQRRRLILAVLVAGAMLFVGLVFFMRSEPVALRGHLMTTISDAWRVALGVPFRPHQHWW